VNPVDPATRLAALMRSQVAALRRPAGVRQPSGSAAAKARSGAPQQGADFASIVAQRMKAIEPNDPAREQKAVRIYLESVILAELGPGLVNDPAFSLLIDDVHGQMAGDPELARSLAEAAELLLGRT
jgi:hypothetical protein